MTENENQTVETPKEVSEGSIELTQEHLDQYPHLVNTFGCKVGDVVTEAPEIVATEEEVTPEA